MPKASVPDAHHPSWVGACVATLLVLLALFAVWEMRVIPAKMGVGDAMQAVQYSGSFFETTGNEVPLRSHFTGIESVDFGLSFLVTAFLPAAGGWDRGYQLFQCYFLGSFYAIISIWSVEAVRLENKGSLISFTAIWAIFYQTVGGAVIVPLYYLAAVRLASSRNYQPVSQVNLMYAKALPLSLILGYLVPTIMVYLPRSDPNLYKTQFFVALWQISPFLVNILILGLSWLFTNMSLRSEKWDLSKRGLKHINRVYLVSFAATAILHISTVFLLVRSSDPHLTFQHSFLIGPIEKGSPFGSKIHRIFQFDFWIIFAAALIWTYYSFWELKHVLHAEVPLTKSFGVISLAAACLGPASAISGAWYWREQLLARDEAYRDEKPKTK